MGIMGRILAHPGQTSLEERFLKGGSPVSEALAGS